MRCTLKSKQGLSSIVSFHQISRFFHILQTGTFCVEGLRCILPKMTISSHYLWRNGPLSLSNKITPIAPNCNAIAQLSIKLALLIILLTHFVFFSLFGLWLKCSFDTPKAIPPDPDGAQRFSRHCWFFSFPQLQMQRHRH